MPPNEGAAARAGYSARPLREKLGIKPGARMGLIGAPPGYLDGLAPLPPGVQIAEALDGPLDFVQVFVRERAALEAQFPALRAALASTGALWVSWPKRASNLPTDLTENMIREIGLAHGLVDVKICAIDAQWSGLKFVYRLKDRR